MSVTASAPGSISPAFPGEQPPEWPWWRLPGAIGEAGSPRRIVLALVGLILTVAGGAVLGRLSGNETGAIEASGLGPRPSIERLEGPDDLREALLRSARTIADPFRVVAGPIAGAFKLGEAPAGFGPSLLAALWSLVVWGVIGGAIGRLAVDRMDPLGEWIGVWTTVRFMGRRVRSLVAAPLGMLVVIGLLAVPGAVVGLMARVGIPGAETIAGAGMGLFLVLAAPSAILLVVLLIGWPLMVLTVAIEGEDGFEAVSRTFGYLSRRWALAFGALLLAWLGGAAGLLLASQFVRLVLHLAGWALTIGGLGDQVTESLFWSSAGRADGPPMLGGWLTGLGWVLHAWAFSYFWSANARIYLWLRSEVDGTPWHDLYRPEEDAEPFAPEPDQA